VPAAGLRGGRPPRPVATDQAKIREAAYGQQGRLTVADVAGRSSATGPTRSRQRCMPTPVAAPSSAARRRPRFLRAAATAASRTTAVARWAASSSTPCTNRGGSTSSAASAAKTTSTAPVGSAGRHRCAGSEGSRPDARVRFVLAGGCSPTAIRRPCVAARCDATLASLIGGRRGPDGAGSNTGGTRYPCGSDHGRSCHDRSGTPGRPAQLLCSVSRGLRRSGADPQGRGLGVPVSPRDEAPATGCQPRQLLVGVRRLSGG
jgi:hypothetical protein